MEGRREKYLPLLAMTVKSSRAIKESKNTMTVVVDIEHTMTFL